MAQIREITGRPTVGDCFNKGLEVYKRNFVPIFVGSLLVGLISIVTLGICAAPMSCGLLAMILATMRGAKRPEPGDVFKQFDKFLPAFLAMLALGAINFIVSSILTVVPILGWIANLFFSAAMAAAMQWALLLIVDQGATVGDAITVPLKLVADKRFWPVVLVVYVASLVAAAGILLLIIGVLFTAPLAGCITVAAYEEAYGARPAFREPPSPAIEG